MSLGSLGSFELVDVTDEHVEALEERYAPLTDELRRLVDLGIRTEVEDDDVREAVALLQQAGAVLSRRLRPGPAGVAFNSTGRSWQWGNAAVGTRNAVAPPLRPVAGDDGVVRATVHLGNQYEGQPGQAHGGVSALLLDHLMGVAASRNQQQVTVTGTLTMRYVGALPLGEVALEAWVSGTEGRKLFVTSTVTGADGLAVEGSGVFIVPRWALPGAD